MKVNYVLMYGTPYLKYKEFEKFDEISKYLVNKGICNYRIFEPMEDLKEMEMIHLENDVRVLEGKIKQLQSQLKAKEEENKRYRELGFKYLNDQNNKLKEVIKEAREYLKGVYEMSCYTKSIILDKEGIEELDEILSKGENK